MNKQLTRRQFTITASVALGALAVGDGCAAGQSREVRQGRISARPRADATTSLRSGPLGLSAGGRDGVLFVPDPPAARSIPLLVFLHGATQTGAGMLRRIGAAAEAAGAAVLAPDSRATTWDAIRGDFGDDVAFLNQALEYVFARLNVDPARLAIGGFSDGASYALSLGIANGDLFRYAFAFSPGFIRPPTRTGTPRVFITHGTRDAVLPVGCSRRIVPALRQAGYDVSYREFEGGHEVPDMLLQEAMDRLSGRVGHADWGA